MPAELRLPQLGDIITEGQLGVDLAAIRSSGRIREMDVLAYHAARGGS
jgi:hypothetical protein